ncbi:MAG: DUF3291 domain-containing protein [Chloroflexia bacterium]|nr:DUF3291 domain-containing protein [Chloroflexia bacterium]
MSRLAFMTFGILREAHGHPAVQGFHDQGKDVFATVDITDGLIDRCRYAAEGDPFGAFVTGRFVTLELADRVAQTLSLWTSFEDVYAFSYVAEHADALRRRKDWFLKGTWPTYVAWWVADGRWPQWRDANARLEHLHDHGATAFAFDFRSPYAADGRPVTLERTRIATLRGR